MNQPQFEKLPREFQERPSYSNDRSVRPKSVPDSSLAQQLSAVASHVGLVDRSSLTKVKLVGKDSVDLLQRLSTNDLRTLTSSSCVHTVLTTEKGRVIDFTTLHRLSESVLILISHALREKVLGWIEKFIIMEDLSVSDITSAYSLFSLFGPEVKKILPTVGINHQMGNDFNSVTETKIGNIQLIVGGAEPVSTSNVNILVPVGDADTLSRKLAEEGSQLGLEPCSIHALEVQRIERGFPVYGRELTEELNPLEAGLEQFVSFTKGCYIGQEVIARLDTYRKLQKRLVGLHHASDCNLTQGGRIIAQGNDVEWVTSAAPSPLLNRTIALAYVRSAWAVPDTSVDVRTESGTHEAQVVQLPFEV